MKSISVQLLLPGLADEAREKNGRINKVNSDDRAFHDWYRFVLAYPPHLVRQYLREFEIQPGQRVLDPFCGTGTTLIEAKLNGMDSIGLEANPFAHFASSVKVNWDVDGKALRTDGRTIAEAARQQLGAQGIDDDRCCVACPDNGHLKHLNAGAEGLIIKDSISPLPLHKTLVLLECLHSFAEPQNRDHLLLALANALVYSISNLRFGPEVGVDKVKEDVSVIPAWLTEVDRIAGDLQSVAGRHLPPATVHLADARIAGDVLSPNSVHAVITSPPYPNEKDYTRTTRLESVVLGFINSRADLRTFKRQLVRSNTRVVYKDDDDDSWIEHHAEIQRIADEIEARRIELGKTSGFERLYSRATRLYFGGMARHLAGLRTVLCPGALLAYVVGDQASYLRVMIRTGQLLAEIAQELGYELVRIDLFRTRFATATKKQLREEVVVLRWPGNKG